MTNEQFYILLAAPILFNFGITATFFMLINSNMNARMDMLERALNKRIDDLREEVKELRQALFPSKQHKVN